MAGAPKSRLAERGDSPFMPYSAIHPNWEKPRDNMVDGYSLEMTAKETEGLREAAPLVRPGTQIAITWPRKRNSTDTSPTSPRKPV